MEKHSASITTIPVTIKVIEVGGKKMTISVFNQIPERDFYFMKEEFRDEAYLGWVNNKDRNYIIYILNGILYKTDTNDNHEPHQNYNEDDDEFEVRMEKYRKIQKVYNSYLKYSNQLYIAT